MRGLAVVLGIGALAVPPPAAGQDLAARVGEMRDGAVRLAYATRPGVCGSGRNVMTVRDTDDWEPDCEAGPAHVLVTFRDGQLVDVDTYVGGRWRESRGPGVRDLGVVSAPVAAAYLLSLAERSEAGAAAIFPATIADSVDVWPRLLTIARTERLATKTRKHAVFWLGQAAGARITAELAAFVEDAGDREIQKHAVFSLSQRGGEAVPALLRIAREHRDPAIRKAALFWLGQSGDPRALALFEELLVKQ
ncbi:MAG: HEAT repeat domain-containing protein [Gemmatimonadota bacterium]|nr:HEAT repeat domain-containing protein [Gemmatimonadota bacterium]